VSANENGLIDLLSRVDQGRLVKACEAVPLAMNQVLGEPGDPQQAVYFPLKGFISMVSLVDGERGVEVGMVGREGVVGGHAVLGVPSWPWRVVVQGQGEGLRLGLTAFNAQAAQSESLRCAVSRHLYLLMAQQAATSACTRFHLIRPRLARWLLMSQDRAESDEFRITHEFLAYMLGVRRVGITAAAGGLQRQGLIDYRRGEIRVLDRPGLEAAACSCYRSDKRLYEAWVT
jgi:CRP-like cAMP-binding protein